MSGAKRVTHVEGVVEPAWRKGIPLSLSD
jgi:hypothetical protein